MKQLTEKRHINSLVFLCSVIYFTSYISRINLAAVILDIVRSEGFLSSEISLAITGSFITYGAGQIISGYLCDKFSPKYILFAGLLATALMNFLVPFCPAATYMVLLWSINGFAQALMWPPISKILATMLNSQDYRNASTKVSWGSSFGTIAVYIIAPLCVSFANWKSIFWLATIACLFMSVIWLACFGKIEKLVYDDSTTKTLSVSASRNQLAGENIFSNSTIGIIVLLLIVITCIGALRDSITTWMPTYIGETFNLGSSVSILTGVVLPIFSIANYQLASWIYGKKIKNELACSGVFFAITLLFSLLLMLTANRMALLSVLCFALLSGSMHGAGLMLTCMIVPYFKRPGLMAGVLNSCTYMGSAASTYGIAVVSEKFGWSATIIVWTLIALLGTVLCFLIAKSWGKNYTFKNKKQA
ncbi:MAG: MFS transporter [Clostridia bacterium]|nr:MFS transporter [Clostridia bacterium]